MSDKKDIHKRIQQLSDNFIGGSPYIHFERLASLQMTKEDLVAVLLELEADGMIISHGGTPDVFRLTPEGQSDIE